MQTSSNSADLTLHTAMCNRNAAQELWRGLRDRIDHRRTRKGTSSTEMDSLKDAAEAAHTQYKHWKSECRSLLSVSDATGGAQSRSTKDNDKGKGKRKASTSLLSLVASPALTADTKRHKHLPDDIDALACTEEFFDPTNRLYLMATNSTVFSSILAEAHNTNSARRLIHEVGMERNTTHQVSTVYSIRTQRN